MESNQKKLAYKADSLSFFGCGMLALIDWLLSTASCLMMKSTSDLSCCPVYCHWSVLSISITWLWFCYSMGVLNFYKVFITLVLPSMNARQPHPSIDSSLQVKSWKNRWWSVIFGDFQMTSYVCTPPYGVQFLWTLWVWLAGDVIFSKTHSGNIMQIVATSTKSTGLWAEAREQTRESCLGPKE